MNEAFFIFGSLCIRGVFQLFKVMSTRARVHSVHNHFQRRVTAETSAKCMKSTPGHFFEGRKVWFKEG